MTGILQSLETPTGTWADLVANAMPGDLVFFWHEGLIARIIEDVTNGGPSHVGMVVSLDAYDPSQLYFLEAVVLYGVRLIPLSHYAKDAGVQALVRREAGYGEDARLAIGAGVKCLGQQYEIDEELQIAAKKIAPWVRIEKSDKRWFCSGLIHHAYAATHVPFADPPQGNATPEFLYRDAGNRVVLRVDGRAGGAQ